MKKQNLKSLKLSKSSVSKLTTISGGVADAAATCESPCQGGTGCCNGSVGVCYDPESYSAYNICICPITVD